MSRIRSLLISSTPQERFGLFLGFLQSKHGDNGEQFQVLKSQASHEIGYGPVIQNESAACSIIFV